MMTTVKTWIVDEEYPAMNMSEMVENVTRECAKRLMNETDYTEFCKLQDVYLQSRADAAAEYARTHYFPGCYGDALEDC